MDWCESSIDTFQASDGKRSFDRLESIGGMAIEKVSHSPVPRVDEKRASRRVRKGMRSESRFGFIKLFNG